MLSLDQVLARIITHMAVASTLVVFGRLRLDICILKESLILRVCCCFYHWILCGRFGFLCLSSYRLLGDFEISDVVFELHYRWGLVLLL